MHERADHQRFGAMYRREQGLLLCSRKRKTAAQTDLQRQPGTQPRKWHVSYPDTEQLHEQAKGMDNKICRCWNGLSMQLPGMVAINFTASSGDEKGLAG